MRITIRQPCNLKEALRSPRTDARKTCGRFSVKRTIVSRAGSHEGSTMTRPSSGSKKPAATRALGHSNFHETFRAWGLRIPARERDHAAQALPDDVLIDHGVGVPNVRRARPRPPGRQSSRGWSTLSRLRSSEVDRERAGDPCIEQTCYWPERASITIVSLIVDDAESPPLAESRGASFSQKRLRYGLPSALARISFQ